MHPVGQAGAEIRGQRTAVGGKGEVCPCGRGEAGASGEAPVKRAGHDPHHAQSHGGAPGDTASRRAPR